MRALIIDDERLARVELYRLLKSHPHVEIVGEARNGEEALQLIRKLSPTLLFLDIQMPHMSGFDVLEQIPKIIPHVIFTTAFDQYAIRAFEINALDYLLKPIASQRLAQALQRIPLQPATTGNSQVFVRDGDRCWIVQLSNIFLMESEGNYTRLYFDTERPLIRRSLNALEQQIDPLVFFRASRKQILNLAWIKSTDLNVKGGLTITLKNGLTIEMSRRQSERLRSSLSL